MSVVPFPARTFPGAFSDEELAGLVGRYVRVVLNDGRYYAGSLRGFQIGGKRATSKKLTTLSGSPVGAKALRLHAMTDVLELAQIAQIVDYATVGRIMVKAPPSHLDRNGGGFEMTRDIFGQANPAQAEMRECYRCSSPFFVRPGTEQDACALCEPGMASTVRVVNHANGSVRHTERAGFSARFTMRPVGVMVAS